jgi:hypothetical protein
MSPEVKAAMDAAGASAENQKSYGGESNGT